MTVNFWSTVIARNEVTKQSFTIFYKIKKKINV